MTGLRRLGRRLRRDRRGAVMVEYAFVCIPLFIILLVLTDFGYRAYIGSMVEGALHKAARRATVGNQTPDQIDAFIRSQLSSFQRNVTVTIDKRSYSQFSGVGKDEKYVDSNANGVYDRGVDCYYDDNGNGMWDPAATAGRTGLGGSDDLVYYTVRADFPRIVPLSRFLGWADAEQVQANMVLKNQPYGSQAFPQCKK
ncbi:TadE/TadG family type IV pilus assembly protein [Sphingomonas profundi]|uniref:TadE/TadG family type IV pilus assembly protein n=1 Tax=Alterirhizorhabdus profundi TaxID=2681549 RepID=UPI001E4D8503|nr:TadE/TadG family type IV pilus assembly protein [Sphingomonas profundi]